MRTAIQGQQLAGDASFPGAVHHPVADSGCYGNFFIAFPTLGLDPANMEILAGGSQILVFTCIACTCILCWLRIRFNRVMMQAILRSIKELLPEFGHNQLVGPPRGGSFKSMMPQLQRPFQVSLFTRLLFSGTWRSSWKDLSDRADSYWSDSIGLDWVEP